MADLFEQEPRQFSRRHQLRGITAGLPAGGDSASSPRFVKANANGRYQSLQTPAADRPANRLRAIEVIIAAANEGRLRPSLPGTSQEHDLHNALGPVENKRSNPHRKGNSSAPNTEDQATFEAMIVSMIRSQVSDPLAQDQAIAAALNAAGHVRSIAELEQIVAAIKMTEAAATNDSALGNGDRGGHYRDDGTWVDEHSYSGGTNDMFSTDSAQSWRSWANKYGTGPIAGYKSSDVYYAVNFANTNFAGHPGVKRLAASADLTAETSKLNTDKGPLTVDEAHIVKEFKKEKIDDKRAAEMRDHPDQVQKLGENIARSQIKDSGQNPDTPTNKAAAEKWGGSLSKNNLDFDAILATPKNDAQKLNAPAPGK